MQPVACYDNLHAMACEFAVSKAELLYQWPATFAQMQDIGGVVPADLQGQQKQT